MFKNKNMKSSSQKEEPEDKKKYVFFSDPDVIAKRAETSAITAQITLDLEAQQQTIENKLANSRVSALDIKSLENLLSYHPVQPYPFTFISAVKQKLALGDCIHTDPKAYNPSSQAKSNLTSSVLKANSTQNLYQVVQKMDYIKPLKVPDLKISPKTLDFSSRDNSVSKELPSTKSEITAKEFAHDRSDRTLRTGDKVQRKLDFSFPDGSSIINCENIEPLKAPNVSIASNLCKKKEHVRDSSREKENKSKRMKKDDSLCAKRDEFAQEHTKRNRSPRHVSRKDASNMGNIRLPKNDKSFYATTSNDLLSMRLKDKNVIISTNKKDNDKRQRFFNAQSVESRDNPVESKGRVSSNESSSDKITPRDNNISVLCNTTETKSKDICHMKQRHEIEDSKSDTSDHIFDSDNRQLKEDKSNSIYKEQTKRMYDKSKMSNRLEGKHSANSEPSEDIGSMSETNSSKNRAYHVNSTQLSKSKDLETATEIKQNINFARSIKTSEKLKYTEHSERQLTNTSTKKDDESYSQSIITSKETTTTNDDSNNVDVSTLPEVLFDARRISFRDGYSQQEFHDLTTPEKLNLVRSKNRRRNLIPSSDSEVDARCPKYKPTVKSEKEQEKKQLMHPDALFNQFRAELQFLDTVTDLSRQLDVEKCLYDTKCEQEQKNSQKITEKDEELERTVEDGCAVATVDNNTIEKVWDSIDGAKKNVAEMWRPSDEAHFNRKYYVPANQINVDESAGINYGNKTVVKVAEVQTQTVNDIATQTNISANKQNAQDKLLEIIEKMYEQSSSVENDIPQQSLNSIEQFENLDQIEDISVPSRIRTMSEISLHETTSSIKTETGTEISISTRDVTFSINQYLDLEIEQLIRDENQRCNKMEELLKSREKTLNDKTRKLAQLEEQKRALRDTGQDSRSVKKKQRALILKLQQEQEYLCKIKKLHQRASQERMDILQKQKNMFNPEMSTRNILTKLKRSADNSSPRRLSGPMKGYDIRSNSSRSSVIESDKSQHDCSHIELCLQGSESDVHSIKLDFVKSNDLAKSKESREKDPVMSPKRSDISKHELRSRKYEEKMPRADILQWKQNQRDMESKWIQGHPMKMKRLLENQESSIGVSQSKLELTNTSVPDHVKSESDTLVEELSKKSRTSQAVDLSVQTATDAKEKESNIITANNESIEEEINTIAQDTVSKTTQSSQISEDILQTNTSKSSKKIDKSVTSDRDTSKKSQYSDDLNANSKHKNFKHQKVKSSSSTLTENIQSKSSSHLSEEVTKHQDKRTKLGHELLHLDNNNKDSILSELNFNESQKSLQIPVKHSKLIKDKNLKLSETPNDYESKENVSSQISNRKLENDESSSRNGRSTQNISTSQISTFAISRRSSKESEKNLSKSIVVRSQDRHLEQLLTARETALTSRKNCIKDWMAWHARLKAEEDRVTRMEQTAFKLVATYSNVLNQLDTTISSDTSDVEGRIGLLAEKLEERRIEMARLKREAKKQTKKQLRALEANLLNQIKKYDMTIHEMRKKLETKKTIKETDKLAIEPKSLADFKVPEIPLKRIQDIYKGSDLLRSRSESDLLVTRNQQKHLKVAIPITYDDKHEKGSYKKSTKYIDTKSTNILELKDTNQTVSNEYTSTEAYNKIRTVTSALSTANDTHLEKYALSKETQIEESGSVETKQNSISGNVEDVETNLSTVRSESEVRTLSDARFVDHSTINTESTNNGPTTNVDRSQPKTNFTIRSEIREIGNVDYVKSIPSKSDYSTESAARTVADSDILTYSRKLDFLQLNNKNLSEDISSIENDIKMFSEIMSRLNNESDEKSKIENDERNTSQDISEIISKSVFSDKIADISNKEKHTISGEINTGSLSISANNGKSKSPNGLSHDKYKSDEINSEISAIFSEDVHLSDLAREIDYEAKSKEIMNEIEKSIISEHVKTVRGDYNNAATSILENEDKESLNDLVSELEVKSISEIFSKMLESRRNLDRATNTATEIIDDSRRHISERSVNLNEEKLEKDSVKNQAEEADYSLKFSERSNSPIIAGHRSKENCETRSAVSSEALRVVAGEDSRSSDNIPEILEAGIDDTRISKDLDEDVETSSVLDRTKHSHLASNADQNQSQIISTENISPDRSNWTTSDSFHVPQDGISIGEQDENSRLRGDHTEDASNNFSRKYVSRCVDDATNPEAEINSASDVNVSACIPKGESTKVDNNVLTESQAMKSNDELDDILDIIARENNREENIPNEESEKLDVISDSMAEILEKVKDIVENDQRGSVDNRFKGILCDMNIDVNDETEAVLDLSSLNDRAQSKINVEDISESNVDYPSTRNDNRPDNREKVIDISLQAVDETEEKSAVRVNLRVEIDNEEESPRAAIPEIQEIIITELDSDSVEDNVLSELEIDAKVELAEEEESAASYVNEDEENRYHAVKEKKDIIEIKECLESILEQDSSDGEQLDNLVEVAESGLDTVEKVIASSRDFPVSIIDDAVSEIEGTKEETDDKTAGKTIDEMITIPDAPIIENLNKTFDILKDPEYEDISEESLEVSEILDKNDLPKAGIARKSSNLPDKYQATQKSEDVLRILDEISQRSSSDSTSNSQRNEKSETQEEISELLDAEVSAEDDDSSPEMNKMTRRKDTEEKSYGVDDESRSRFLKGVELRDERSLVEATRSLPEEKDAAPLRLDANDDDDDKSTRIIYELQERVSRLREQDGSSGESSEAGDTPRGVSDIEMDSPRDFNDSRLDIDILDDDLLSGKAMTNQSVDVKTNFHSASIVATSENDITAMIDKLKASLEQPGLEVAELEAKLLRIEQLQIELEIKKLEAEEVSFYVREIPNKPPPPYTPPGDGRLSASLGSPSLVTAVIPSNVEELTSFTEKATTLIYNAKLAGEDIASLEAPIEIYESIKDKTSENKDRRIYNTFLFDLCKEIIMEVFRAEYEKPGPSWTKPNVKTKPAMKIPKTVVELVEYVNKEVATLFGFKTKLQRENMVMRWSRKRRDRVDELLAREAQAEEDEWTKFHHDELVVKNGLTVTILDTLVMETANVVKIAYGKKRRIMV